MPQMIMAKLAHLATNSAIHVAGAVATSAAERAAKNALSDAQNQAQAAQQHYPADNRPAAPARGMPQSIKLMGHRINIGPLARRLNPLSASQRQVLKDALNFILPDVEPGTNEQGHMLYASVTKPEGQNAVPLAVQLEVDKQNNLSKLTAHPIGREGEAGSEPLEAHFEAPGNSGLPAGLSQPQRAAVNPDDQQQMQSGGSAFTRGDRTTLTIHPDGHIAPPVPPRPQAQASTPQLTPQPQVSTPQVSGKTVFTKAGKQPLAEMLTKTVLTKAGKQPLPEMPTKTAFTKAGKQPLPEMPGKTAFTKAGKQPLPEMPGKTVFTKAGKTVFTKAAKQALPEMPGLRPGESATLTIHPDGHIAPPVPPRPQAQASAPQLTPQSQASAPPVPPRPQASAPPVPPRPQTSSAGPSAPRRKTPANELTARFGIDKNGRRLALHELKDKLGHMEHSMFEKHFEHFKDMTGSDKHQVKY